MIGPRAAELTGFDGLGPEYAQRYRDWDGNEVLGIQRARVFCLVESGGFRAASRESFLEIRKRIRRPIVRRSQPEAQHYLAALLPGYARIMLGLGLPWFSVARWAQPPGHD